ncbi:MAG: DUF4296 domain-containing protein [Bacteroidales bacterium]|nr:DUF4296 domain-containing protein [Bacteroidales bacterium]
MIAKRILLVTLGIVLLCGCANNKKKEDGLLTPDEMVAILVDIHLFDATIATYNSVEKKDVKLSGECFDSLIYSRHECNDSIFRKSFEYYALEGKIRDIYEEVIDSLNVMKINQEQKSK